MHDEAVLTRGGTLLGLSKHRMVIRPNGSRRSTKLFGLKVGFGRHGRLADDRPKLSSLHCIVSFLVLGSEV